MTCCGNWTIHSPTKATVTSKKLCWLGPWLEEEKDAASSSQKSIHECWCFPKTPLPKKVKVLNKKFCWLYPERDVKKLKKLEPNFDHCKTLYTKCDFELEQCAHEQILKVEDLFKAHNVLHGKEMEAQNAIIDRMWVLSQRFLILSRAGVCVKLYPDEMTKDTENRTLCEFHEHLRKLNKSNCRLANSIALIQRELCELEHRTRQLDWTVKSPFIVGNTRIRPLNYVRERIADLYKFFYSGVFKLKAWAQLLDPADPGAIEDYVALVKPSNDFDDFLLTGMSQDDKCRRMKNPQCIFNPKTC